MENKINLQIATADDAAIVAAIQTLVNKLQPYLLTLTDEERKGGIKMGTKDIGFIDKGSSYGTQFNSIIPPYISVANLNIDVAAVNKLTNYLRPIATLVRSLEDSIMISGSEAMEAALLVYGALKNAAHNNVNGTQEAVNDMAQRFPGKVKKAKKTENSNG